MHTRNDDIPKTELKWSKDYTIYKSEGPLATPIHKSTNRESPDSLPTYSEACLDVHEVFFWKIFTICIVLMGIQIDVSE